MKKLIAPFIPLTLTILLAIFSIDEIAAQSPPYAEADFDVNPEIGCGESQTVYFTDKSIIYSNSGMTFAADVWIWNFGDGTSSVARNPSHEYTAPGEYTVKLVAIDTVLGPRDDTTKTIKISYVTADFIATSLFGCGPLNVNFTDQSSSAGSGTITAWEWDFGDGTSSTDQNPSHTYSAPGIYSVSLTVTNSNGCSDTKTRSSYVQVIGPVVDFSSDVTTGCLPLSVAYTDGAVSTSPIISWVWNFGDGASSSGQNPSHAYSSPGVFTVSLTVSDLDGCTSSKTYTDLIITDPVLPTITCPGDQHVAFDGDCQFTLPDYTGLATASDNCGTPTVTQSPAVGTVITATQTITLTADDGASNIAQCTFEVIPEDNTLPVITCPGDQHVDFDAGCQFTLSDYTGLATVSDNCGTPTVTQSPAAGTVISGIQTITLTATDGNGNSTQCTFDVIPEDNTKPVINCPGNQYVDFDAACQFTLSDYTGLATVSDNCGTPTVTQSPAAGTMISGTQTITLTATDGNGNTAQCTFDVIPDDNTLPVISCPSDQNVDIDAACQFTLPDYTGLVTVSDNCGTPTVTQSPAAGIIISGTQTISLTATDGNGNTAQCTFEVIPEDNTLPVITCPGDQYVDFDAGCRFTLSDYTGLATVSDNCSTPTVTQSPATGTVISGTQTITLTATDGNGNTAQCTFEVIPEDNTKPVINCPGDQNVDFDAACQFILPDYTGLATASDNCSTPTVTQSPAAGTVISGTQTITLTATDGNGNNAQCTFDVIPEDNTLPVITCPGDQYVDFDAACQFTVPDYTGLATASDNCSTAMVTQSPAAGTIISGTQTITLIATAGNGNTAQCSFDVIPVDNTIPIIICPGEQHVDIDVDCQFTLPDYTGLATASDNCSTAMVTQSPAAGTVISGTQTITLTATDGNGNIAQCTFDVIPFDRIAPIIQCPGDVESCEESIFFNDPTVIDNCPDVTMELISGLPSGATFPVGITTNTYEVIDKGGNTATCSFDITRLALPIIDAGPDLYLDAGFSSQINATVDQPVSFNWTPAIGLNNAAIEDPIASPQQTTIYTLKVTTNDGCTASDEMMITVNEEIEINNFMSPNGDGKNDAWEIKGNWQLEGCKVSIVNSWGDILHESNGYENDWYGTDNGEDLPEGTYYYIISCAEKANRSGIIRLKR